MKSTSNRIEPITFEYAKTSVCFWYNAWLGLKKQLLTTAPMINISYGLIYPPTPEIGSMVRWNIIDSYCKIRPKLCLQIVVSPFLQISWEIIILLVWEPWFMQNMITSPNGNIFRVSGPLWGKTSVTGGLPSQRPVTRSFGVFFFFI